MTGRSKKGELYAAGYQHITLAVTPRFHQNTKTKSQKNQKFFAAFEEEERERVERKRSFRVPSLALSTVHRND